MWNSHLRFQEHPPLVVHPNVKCHYLVARKEQETKYRCHKMIQDFSFAPLWLSCHVGKQGQMWITNATANWLLPVGLTTVRPERPVPMNLLSSLLNEQQKKTRDRRWQAARNLIGEQDKQGCSSSPTVELRWFEYKRVKIKEPRTELSPAIQHTCLRMWSLNQDILLRTDWTI